MVEKPREIDDLFKQFKAAFEQEFLWSNHSAVDLDENKLADLFRQYVDSEGYPSLDELRGVFSFLHKVPTHLKEDYDDYYVTFPGDFDRIIDAFEEILERAFQSSMHSCQTASRVRRSQHRTKSRNALPENAEELVSEYKRVQRQRRGLQSEMNDLLRKRSNMLSPFPRLKTSYEQKSGVQGAKEFRVYHPNAREILSVWRLPNEVLTKDEEIVQQGTRKLLGELFNLRQGQSKLRQQLARLTALALLKGVTLHEQKRAEKSDQSAHQVERVPQKRGKSPQNAKFPSPKNLNWEEVSMAFVSNETLEIRARNVIKKYHYAEIGFKDNRKVDTPNRLWLLLKEIFGSEEFGELSYDGKVIEGAQKSISRLRTILKGIMSIEEDPFYPYWKLKAYRPRFSVIDKTAGKFSEPYSPQPDYETEEMDDEVKQVYQDDLHLHSFS